MNTDIWNSDNAKALADHHQAMKIAAKTQDTSRHIRSTGLPHCVMSAKDADKADEMCRKAIAAAREHGSPLEASNAYFVRAVEHALTKGPSHRTERMFLDGIEYASRVDSSSRRSS